MSPAATALSHVVSVVKSLVDDPAKKTDEEYSQRLAAMQQVDPLAPFPFIILLSDWLN